MRAVLPAAGRPLLLGLAGLGLAAALGTGPVLDALAAQDDIAMARDRLARAQAAALAPPAPAPLSAADEAGLVAAFQSRLTALAAERSVAFDGAGIQPDLSRPTLPRLSASLRGTAEGLHGLLDALETGIPLVVLEEAEISVERPADPEIGRATVLRLTLTARGVLPPAPAAKAIP
ncbi:GspMb/PilO family protein [Methylobacterium sp. SyP6R]|uniref:GspMb/PilO family protein n=1 Tax=Methylobacterium sp. SyP6R TaxID=2718876 RepID=UPI001F3146B6|nr:GspMb/PilO family protein [Methylobacterium sp. SyP6R]MCF4125472.1 type II secretion system protein M [Methylobacterium sp. SyP6R]